jgi:hypothetical protein
VALAEDVMELDTEPVPVWLPVLVRVTVPEPVLDTLDVMEPLLDTVDVPEPVLDTLAVIDPLFEAVMLADGLDVIVCSQHRRAENAGRSPARCLSSWLSSVL